MPEFLADPSVLTKEKLKSELIANNVSLPGGEQRKDVYVQLYLQHLTARNAPGVPAQLDFSSDEERERTSVPARNRGGSSSSSGATGAVGRKVTKKTDKPRPEEHDDIDVTELSNEELKDQLVKYGVNPGPIVATTRKLYEKKLLKLKEPGQDISSFFPTPTVSSSAENSKQNGNDDSDQYSDSEDPKTVQTGELFKLEKREPLKGKIKASVTLKQRRTTEHNQNYSQDGVTETSWRSGSSRSGLLQAVSRESARVSRRTPRKRVETTVPLPVHDAVISENTPIADTVVASSNKTLVNQVVSRVSGNVKHADPILSVSDYTELSRRPSKKPLMTTEVTEKISTEEKRMERDILKEMFPYEASTPTGISASCRRPIKGAAGRPIEHSDFRLDETYSSKYIPKYVASGSSDVKPEKPAVKKRSIPLWIKILLFVVVAVFLFLVYQSMETNQGNPFSQFQSGNPEEKTD